MLQLRHTMLRRLLRGLGLVGLAGSLYVSLVEAPYAPTGFLTPNEVHDLPRVIAHKAHGGAGDVPGDTLEAVQALLDTDIEAFEIDIQLSKDGVPFVFHE